MVGRAREMKDQSQGHARKSQAGRDGNIVPARGVARTEWEPEEEPVHPAAGWEWSWMCLPNVPPPLSKPRPHPKGRPSLPGPCGFLDSHPFSATAHGGPMSTLYTFSALTLAQAASSRVTCFPSSLSTLLLIPLVPDQATPPPRSSPCPEAPG